MAPASSSLPRNITMRALCNQDTGFILLTVVQDNSTKRLDNRRKGASLRLLVGQRRQRWPVDGQNPRPEIAPTDYAHHETVRRLYVHVSVRQQVLSLEPD